MGRGKGERDGERRGREELEGGKVYGDIILGQVGEVFPGFGGGERRGEEREEMGRERGGVVFGNVVRTDNFRDNKMLKIWGGHSSCKLRD